LNVGLAKRLRRSTAFRFIALYVVLNFAAALPVFLYVYQATDRLVLSEFRARVIDEAALFRAEHQAGGIGAVARGISERLAPGGGAGDALLLVDPAGRTVAGNVAAWPPTVQETDGWTEMPLYRKGHVLAEPIGLVTLTFPDGYRLLIGQVMEDRRQLREALAKALAGALLLGLPLGLAGSAVLLRFLNRRVRAISAIAAEVAAGELRHRIDTAGTRDPFDELASALNTMLDRLESLVEELRFVTDSLAHDLRSPLTRMRGAIESALGRDDPAMCQAALEAVSREIQTMLSMLETTLEVSRAEAGIGRESFAAFDLAALARDLADMYVPLAEENGVVLEIEAPNRLDLVGNRELIAQALANLIDNALKYGSAGGKLLVRLEAGGGQARLSVADRGPGIPEEERATALLKYRRLDHARSSPGSGLGLSLVGAVARLHGGTIGLADNQPGLVACLELPLRPGQVTEPS
jgi:signal transduction histidine kinase